MNELINQQREQIALLMTERDNAWQELREIREAINANPEESTADEVRRVMHQKGNVHQAMEQFQAQSTHWHQQAEALAAHIKQLEECLEQRKSVCRQAFDANDAMKAERDALAATVAGINDEISDFLAALDGMLMADLSSEEIAHDLEKRLSNYDLSQQHLAEIRAEAGRDGFIAGYEFCLSTLPSPYSNLIAVNYKGMAERYADSIRQEGK